MYRKAILVILVTLLAACSRASGFPTGTPTATFRPPTRTLAPTLTRTSTEPPAASITPPSIPPVAIHPLALNETNAGLGMQRLAVFGTGEPNDLAWSPDGSIFAVATTRGVWLYDGATLEETGFIDVNDSVSALAFSPDGKILALAVGDKVGLWVVSSGLKIRDLEGEMGLIFELVYGRGGQIAALGYGQISYGGPDSGMILWDGATGELIYSDENIYYLTVALAFSPDGSALAFGSRTGVKVIGSKTGGLIASQDYQPYALAFSSDGGRLFMVGWEAGNKVWDLSQDQLLPFGLGCENDIARGSDVAICSTGNAMTLFDLHDGQTIREIPIQVTGADRFIIDPGGTLFAALSSDQVVDVRTTQNAELVQSLSFTYLYSDINQPGITNGIAIIDEEKRHLLATGIGPGRIEIWDLEAGRVIRTFEAGGTVRDLDFSPDQRSLLSLIGNDKLKVWDIQTAATTHTFDLSQETLLAGHAARLINLGPDGYKVKIIDNYSNVFAGDLRNLDSAGVVWTVTINGPYLFAPNGHLLTETNDEDGFSIINTATQETLLTHTISIPGLSTWMGFDWLDAITMSPDGRYIAYGMANGGMYVWDLASHQQISSSLGHEMMMGDGWKGTYIGFDFSPQSRLLVSVGFDRTTRLWDIYTGNQLRQLNVCCYADFTPDGRYLVTAGDGVIRVWGIPSP